MFCCVADDFVFILLIMRWERKTYVAESLISIVIIFYISTIAYQLNFLNIKRNGVLGCSVCLLLTIYFVLQYNFLRTKIFGWNILLIPVYNDISFRFHFTVNNLKRKECYPLYPYIVEQIPGIGIELARISNSMGIEWTIRIS